MSNNSPYLRALYIVLVPMVLVIILLNSGFIQQHVPAGSVNGESYTAVEYNYYYFTYYNNFIEENEDNLDALGYDSSVSDGDQYVDAEETTTWRAYFLAAGEELLTSTAYYYALSEEAGYEFSEGELSAYDEQLAENQEVMDTYGLTEKSYYIAYYGSGMTADLYKKELMKQVKAMAYKQHLIDTYDVSEEEIDAYATEHDLNDYQSVNLSVITMTAIDDRVTGEIGETQITNLQSKLDALVERYENGTSFTDLQSAFSDCSLGDETGTLSGAVQEDLPEVLSDWCIGTEDLNEGDTCAVIDSKTGVAYFAVFNGYAGSSVDRTATLECATAAVSGDATTAMKDTYAFVRNKLGMTFAAK